MPLARYLALAVEESTPILIFITAYFYAGYAKAFRLQIGICRLQIGICRLQIGKLFRLQIGKCFAYRSVNSSILTTPPICNGWIHA